MGAGKANERREFVESPSTFVFVSYFFMCRLIDLFATAGKKIGSRTGIYFWGCLLYRELNYEFGMVNVKFHCFRT